MNSRVLSLGSLLLVAILSLLGCAPSVTIGTGGVTGVYYPTGGAICRILEKNREIYGVRCSFKSTRGSVSNINSIMAGDLEFGMAQSNRQYQAWYGLSEWRSKGPQKNLRAVFSVYAETLNLVAAADSEIKTIQDLRGKRVNIGNPFSGQRQMSIDALEKAGIIWRNDIDSVEERASKAPRLLQDGRIDAFFYTTFHPSGALKEASSGKRKVRFIPIINVENLITKYPYYAKAMVPVKFYPGVLNRENVQTFGVKATFVTSAKVPEQIVYTVTKQIFDNLEEFKQLHRAYLFLTKENALEALTAPIHPGALKYYKEVGLQ